MIRIDVNELSAGMKTARPIYDEEGRILLAEGVELKASMIVRLKEMGYHAVYIADARTADISHPEIVGSKIRSQVTGQVRKVFEKASTGGVIGLSDIAASVDDLIDEILASRNLLVSLDDVRSVGDYTFTHSVNVCVLSVVIGVVLGLDQAQLRELAIGAILHDIGKVRVRPEVLHKTGRLTLPEMQEVKRHTRHGFDILRTDPLISLRSAHIAYQHHERLSGKGYPRGLRGDEIHPFARITMVADTFDAMTADRVYRKAVPRHAALALIGRLAGRQLPTDAVRALQQSVAMYPVGCRIRLDSGEVGVVIDVSRRHPSLPRVRIIEGADGLPILDGRDVDLSQESERAIVEVF